LSREGNSQAEERTFQVNFQKRDDRDEAIEGNKRFQKIANYVKDTITLAHYSSSKPEDWVEEHEVGCPIWVNKHTGEVSPLCPWKKISFAEYQNEPVSYEEDMGGTGSLVYDGSEVEDLFSMLDNLDC
jgi:hypothetical protein